MGRHAKTIHVRLPEDLERRLAKVHSNWRALNVSFIARLLIMHQLRKSEDEISEIIQQELRGEHTPGSKQTNRIGGLNSRRNPS
jgi:predicted DNA-binding protein